MYANSFARLALLVGLSATFVYIMIVFTSPQNELHQTESSCSNPSNNPDKLQKFPLSGCNLSNFFNTATSLPLGPQTEFACQLLFLPVLGLSSDGRPLYRDSSCCQTSAFTVKYLKQPPEPRPFAYLVTIESCITPNWYEYLSRNDVAMFFIAWGEPCSTQDMSFFGAYLHVIGRGTWTTNRNSLYFFVRTLEAHLEWRFLYHIYADGDVTVKIVYEIPSNRGRAPIDLWHEFLLAQTPPIGLARYFPTRPPPSERIDWVDRFDALLNAFRVDVEDFLLPYVSDYDPISWFYSQAILYFANDSIFPQGAAEAQYLVATNTEHRSYPRENNFINCLRWASDHLRFRYGVICPLSKTPSYEYGLYNISRYTHFTTFSDILGFRTLCRRVTELSYVS